MRCPGECPDFTLNLFRLQFFLFVGDFCAFVAYGVFDDFASFRLIFDFNPRTFGALLLFRPFDDFGAFVNLGAIDDFVSFCPFNDFNPRAFSASLLFQPFL